MDDALGKRNLDPLLPKPLEDPVTKFVLDEELVHVWKGNLKDLAQPADWKTGMNTLFFSHGQNASGAGHYRVLGFTLVKK